MTEPDRTKLKWRANIHRTVAWLKAPSDEEDHASFQIDVLWADGVERLPEVYALETSRPGFDAGVCCARRWGGNSTWRSCGQGRRARPDRTARHRSAT